jgi:hypothetical protein
MNNYVSIIYLKCVSSTQWFCRKKGRLVLQCLKKFSPGSCVQYISKIMTRDNNIDRNIVMTTREALALCFSARNGYARHTVPKSRPFRTILYQIISNYIISKNNIIISWTVISQRSLQRFIDDRF